MLATDAKALIYQVPGGMLSNLLSQLRWRNNGNRVRLYFGGLQNQCRW